MIYKMTLTDSSDTMTFNLLETPIVDKDIEGAVDNVTLDGNQYTDYLYLKKQYIQKWAIMCPDEYDELRGFYTRQFEEGEIPSYRVYYGANVTKDYIYNGDYFQFNAKGIETGMYLSQLTGNATQDGTPTPDAPVAVETVTGEQTVKVVGKNLAKSAITTGGNTIQANLAKINYQSGNYAISIIGDVTVSNIIVSIRDHYTNIRADVARIDLVQGQQTSATFTLSESEALALSQSSDPNITMYKVGSGHTVGTVLDVQLELGSQASDYQAFQGQSYTIDLGSIELAKIGTYQDRIYKDDGKWYIEKQVGKVVADGNTNITTFNTANNIFAVRVPLDNDVVPSGYAVSPTISDYLQSVTFANFYSNRNYGEVASHNSVTQPTIYISAPNSSVTTLAQFQTWLASNPTIVYYALATPTTTEITDETLLSQLNFIASLYGGVNNISIVGTGAQGEMEVLIRDVLDVETDVVPETPVRLTLTDGGVINACGCRRDVQLTMRETTE